MKIRSFGAELFHADRWRDMTKVIVNFCNSAKAPIRPPPGEAFLCVCNSFSRSGPSWPKHVANYLKTIVFFIIKLVVVDWIVNGITDIEVSYDAKHFEH
jgi:hypothetical protein